MNLLRERDLITYRAPLALHFTDAVTQQPVRNGLEVVAWPVPVGNVAVVHQVVAAEKSQQSALYGFHSLPGMERYQIGEEIVPGLREYMVYIHDRHERFLPQIQRFALPLATLAAQEVILFSAPTRTIPPGYGVVRGQLVRTTAPTGAPPAIRVREAAAWAAIMVTIAGTEILTFTDAQGGFVAMIPYPPIAADTLFSAAEWTITIRVAHSPTAISAEIDAFLAARPTLVRAMTPPQQNTLFTQSPATLFTNVTVLDVDQREYTILGATDAATVDRQLYFGEPLIIRTQLDGGPDQLPELLIHSV